LVECWKCELVEIQDAEFDASIVLEADPSWSSSSKALWGRNQQIRFKHKTKVYK